MTEPDTLETIGGNVRLLSRSVDERFKQVDRRFDELKAQLRVEIEAVASRLDLVLERLDDFLQWQRKQVVMQKQMLAGLDNHEVRISALEQKRPRKRS